MTTPKKNPPKPKPISTDALSAKRKAIAELCGRIAGIPGACHRAQDAMMDVEARLEAAKGTAGILTPEQARMVDSMLDNARSNLCELITLRRDADTLAIHGAINPQSRPKFMQPRQPHESKPP